MVYILILLGLFGFLPMFIVLYKKNKADKLVKNGIATEATITDIIGFSYRSINIYKIEYPVRDTGEILKKNLRVAGLPYSVGDKLKVYYDPNKPKRMMLDMKKGFIPMLIFTIIIAAVVIWACFKINQSLINGEL